MAVRHVGLTGGIGSGKSTVAGIWVSLAAELIDTDAIAREITSAGGAAMPGLIREFGASIADASGALDRARMRALAFQDDSVRQRLERCLHPMIGEVAVQRARQSQATVIVYDVPLLAESSTWRQRCDRILVVDCSQATQIERVMRRSGWSADQVRRVMSQQSPRERRRRIADAVIDNDSASMDDLRRQVEDLWRLWQPAQ